MLQGAEHEGADQGAEQVAVTSDRHSDSGVKDDQETHLRLYADIPSEEDGGDDARVEPMAMTRKYCGAFDADDGRQLWVVGERADRTTLLRPGQKELKHAEHADRDHGIGDVQRSHRQPAEMEIEAA